MATQTMRFAHAPYGRGRAEARPYGRLIAAPAGRRWCPTVPVQFELLETAEFAPTGKLGSDTVAVMQELGYSREAIDAAQADGSICGEVDLDTLVARSARCPRAIRTGSGNRAPACRAGR